MTAPAPHTASADPLIVTSDSPADTRIIGQAIGAAILPGDVLCLNGDLGAGKTHLTQGIALGAGVSDPVTSPTFTLVNEYEGRVPIAHFDFYRLEQAGELDDIGFDEYLDGARALVIEWAGRFPEHLPDERVDIRIDIGGEQRRILRIDGPEAVIERLRAAFLARGLIADRVRGEN